MSDIVNHDEATLLAKMNYANSNLARCYLDRAAEIERLRAENEKLRGAVTKARDRFCEYQRMHEEKARAANPGGSGRSMEGEAAARWEKAERNREMADLMDAALKEQSDGTD